MSPDFTHPPLGEGRKAKGESSAGEGRGEVGRSGRERR